MRTSSRFVYVGCYTTKERDGRGEGINVYRMEPDSSTWRHVQLFGGLVNPSFLTIDRPGRFLYSVHGDGGHASAFSIDEHSGELELLNQQSTGGQNPVHLVVDPTNQFLIVANYGTGTVATLPINSNGSLSSLSHLAVLRADSDPEAPAPNGSHPHHVVFDPSGRFVVVPDKGADKVFVYQFAAARGKLVANDPPAAMARPGAGPRHVAFHPRLPYAYVVNELASTITSYRFDAARGQLLPVCDASTLPTIFTGSNTTSEIVVSPSGRFVYASNRGHDSLAVLAIEDDGAAITCVGWEPTQGKTPRFFGLDPSGSLLCVANQDSDTIVLFSMSRETGALRPTGPIVETGSPSSIAFSSIPS